MTVKLEIKNSSRITHDKGGYKVERVAMVTGLTGNDDAMLYNALQQSGLPVYGDPHPVIPGITLQKITASPVAGGKFKVVMSYGSGDEDEDEDESEQGKGRPFLSSALTNEQTHFDINGNLIKADYWTLTQSVTQYSAIDVQRPQSRITLSRTESAIPKMALTKYLGKINSLEWSGFPAQTWLCSGISSRKNGDKFEVDYSFEYRADGWKGELVLKLTPTEAENFPIDPDTGNAYALFDVYESANFNNLGLSF